MACLRAAAPHSCGNDPRKMGNNPQALLQGRGEVHHQGWELGGGAVGMEIRHGISARSRQGGARGGAEKKKRPGVKPGKGLTGPGNWGVWCSVRGV